MIIILKSTSCSILKYRFILKQQILWQFYSLFFRWGTYQVAWEFGVSSKVRSFSNTASQVEHQWGKFQYKINRLNFWKVSMSLAIFDNPFLSFKILIFLNLEFSLNYFQCFIQYAFIFNYVQLCVKCYLALIHTHNIKSIRLFICFLFIWY